MKKLTCLFALGFLLLNNILRINEPEKVTSAEEVSETAAKKERIKQVTKDDDYKKFRFGGYGETVAKFMNYGTNRSYGGVDNSDHHSTIVIPRFVLAFDYKFNSKWTLGAEIEFEAGGVGLETELENSENGEYETGTEKGGEVALEQFHITRLIHSAFNIRAGHLIVPTGLTNAHHEPINFFGTSRSGGEATIIPSTWHGTGLESFSSSGKGHARFDYQATIVTGLNADGFGCDNWVVGGKQGLFGQDNFTSPAYTACLDYKGVSGLRAGVTFYYCNDVAANADKNYKCSSAGCSSVRIYSVDAQYKNRYVTARGNIIYDDSENSSKISRVTLSNNSSYYHGAMRNVAKNTLCYGLEAGLNLSAFFSQKKCSVTYPYARYEYHNPQEEVEGSAMMEKRCQVSKWTAEVSWLVLPSLAVKAGYTTRHIGTSKVFGLTGYNNKSEFVIGIVYVGWFTKRQFKQVLTINLMFK